MKFRKQRRGIAGIVATVIMFAILFTVGTSYFVFVNSTNAAYVSSLLTATNKEQGTLQESLTVNTVLETDGDIGFTANDTSAVTVNMTAVLVISDTGTLLKCDGVGFPVGAGCSNTTPPLWMTINAGEWSSSIDTGYTYVTGSTDTVKVITARGNTYSASYPSPADQSSSSQSVTVALDQLKWVQLIPQASSLVQKNYVANCNAANCALAYTSHPTAGDILVDGTGWVNHAAPSTPTDTLGDLFTLGTSSSVTVATTPAIVQSKYTSNCNAATCGLAFASNVASGDELVYSVGWANHAAPSAPTDTRGDTFTLGASQSLTVNPPSPALVQHRYLADCNSATCGLAYSSSVTAGNTLVFGLGWYGNTPYVPVTITNCCVSGTLALDGSTGAGTESSSVSATLTTTSSNDVIILSAGTSSSSTSVSSVSDAGGHAWTQRATETGSPSVEEEEWYTTASAPLSSDSITVTWSASGDNVFSAFGISGANTASPFDANGALPAVATGSGTSPSVSVSTSNANDFIVGMLANEHTSFNVCHTETLGGGFTDISPQSALGSNTCMNSDQEYQIVSATQSGLAIPFTTNSGGSNQWAEIGDAIKASSGAATPTTFQEMVVWNPSTYSAYESSTLGNVRFCADSACATPLDAWLESCTSSCSPSATSATAWVKLTSSIAAGGTLTIYMAFDATSVNFDTNYWGEAPSLSTTYGQYDNGANVFTFYDNFAGSSLSSLWTNNVGNAGGTLTINNGLSYTRGGSGNNYPFIYSTSTFSQGVYETYGNIPSGGRSGSYTYAGFGLASSSNLNAGAGVGDWNAVYGLYTGTTSAQNVVSGLSGGTYVWQLFVPSSSPSSISGSQNYGSTLTSSTDMPTLPTNIAFTDQYNSGVNLGTFNWARDRAYPPNGVMPSTSFGSLSTGTASPTSVSDTLGDSFTVGAAQSASSGPYAYESSIWYATAASSGSDTITATFTGAVPGSVSVYEIAGYSTSGVLSSTGSSPSGSTTASVGSFTPSSNSFVVGNVETGSASSKYTAGSGYATVAAGSGGCDASDASQGCNEYESGVGSATTAPFTLSASTLWVEAAMSFGTLTSSTYNSYVYYAPAGSSGADTISASFGSTVAGSVSIYEISGVTATGLLTGTGSSSTSQGATAVATITPTVAGSVVIGSAETTSTTYTAGSGYTLTNSQSCATVTGCAEYQTGVGSGTTVPMSISPSAPWVEAAVAFAPIQTTYYSDIWYATAASSGADTITAAFGTTVTASVSIYELAGFTTSGALSSTGSSSAHSTTSGVASFSPASDSFTVGQTEASASNTLTAGSGFTVDGSCTSTYGCSEYNAGGGGAATTVPMTLGTSAAWVETAMSFGTPFNPQSGIQVGGYPTMGVPSGASLVWEVTFTNVDPLHRAITIWPQTEMAIGSAEYDGFDTDYTQAHYYLINSLNPGSTTVNAYSTSGFITLAYNTPTTLYFAATQALGSTTQAFGTNVLTPFEAYFALTGLFSDGTLFGETIPYPYGIITQANAYTTPTAGLPSSTVTVSCTTPCDFTHGASAIVGWINSSGEETQVATFTVNSSGNIPSGVTFTVPATATAGYYTIEVTDYINSVFMTFQVT